MKTCFSPIKSWARDNFIASPQRQRNNVIEPRGPEKIRNIFRSRCLDGVATPRIVILQYHTTVWPENMVSLSRQYCRGPSSGSSSGTIVALINDLNDDI